MRKIITKIKLHPIMTFMILIIATMLLSGILSFFGFEATYLKVNPVTGTYDQTLVTVESLFNLSGLKYIFSSTVANFASFTPLSMCLIILIGIGIMEKSGFLKVLFTYLTQKTSKRIMTFILVLICILFSLAGDISYAVMIPLSALLFYYGRRNPMLGVVTSFAALSCGRGLSIFLTSVDSTVLSSTLESAVIFDPNYSIGTFSFLIIMLFSILFLSFILTGITERLTVYSILKYEFKDDKKELKLGRREIRGLVMASIGGFLYLLIFIYNIIPGIPFGGNLLDYSQSLYIDKLFSYNSFFSQGFVFIVTIFFVILGLFYGIGAKTIKNNHDLCECLGHSLDGIGNSIILIFMASVFINVFKKTNIGVVFTVMLTNLLSISSFKGVPLILLFFIIGAITSLLLPTTISKWPVMVGTAVPVLMNAGISPEMTQIIFRFSEGVTYGLTPIMAYFVIYLAYMEKFNQEPAPISLFTTIKYQIPYSIGTALLLGVIIILWYIIGIPLGIGAFPTI